MSTSEMKLLQKKRERTFRRIQAVLDASEDLSTTAKIRKFKILREELPQMVQNIQELVDQINQIELQDPKAEPDLQVLDVVDDMVLKISIAAQSLEEAHDSSTAQDHKGERTRRLPEVPLPSFAGEQKSWLMFKDRFESLIHNNSDLTDFEKINFLMGSLKGEPLKLCSNLPPIGKNYEIIWKTLKDQYDDRRVLANQYLDDIIRFKQLSCESVNNFNLFFENFHLVVEALKKLEIPDLTDYIFAYLALSKLPPDTQKTFENSYRGREIIKYEEVISFLKEQRKICFRADSARSKPETAKRNKIKNFFVHQENKNSCFLCDKPYHRLSDCPKFLERSPRLRYEIIKNEKRCINCLSFHKISKCNSAHLCRHCRGRHHTLLHFLEKMDTPEKEEKLKNENGKVQTGKIPVESKTFSLIGYSSGAEPERNNSHVDEKIVLLSTAVVAIFNNLGFPKMCRFLLDSGSQTNFLTEECARFLKLKLRPCHSKIQGLGGSDPQVKGCVTLTLTSHLDPKIRYVLDAIVVKRIVDKLPTMAFNRKNFDYLNNVSLADPKFHIPSKIDGILGVDMLTRILDGERIFGPPDYPIAISTRLGYVVMGSVPKFSPAPQNVHVFCNVKQTSSLEDSLKQFWELENVPFTNPSESNSELDFCEDLFRTSHTRNQRGRFVVKIPFRLSPNLLGDSYQPALERFLHLEKKFRRDPTFKKHYCEIIREYLEQGHMILEKNPEISNLNYFIPHHGVFKRDSSSTPLRIVFDASCKTSSRYSLNDLLHSGPKLQTDIVAVLLRFRLGKFGFTADLKQMFRQILVSEEDRRFQKIIWRDSENDSLKIFCLTTVTFGLKCSPYLALRVVQQLANDEKERFPEASELARRDMYVDDLVYSTNDSSFSIQLYEQLIEMFRGAGFEVHKWATNCEELNNIISPENVHRNPFDFHKNSLKVLGMHWDPMEDLLQFKFRIDHNSSERFSCTKRKILSVIARCYDPLGFLAPALLLAKLIIRDLWQQTLDWDDIPPEDIRIRWKSFREELLYLAEIKIPRFLKLVPDQSVTLIGFADACATSYDAVVYLRNSTNGPVSEVSLIYAKSKVAPGKALTIPKLELMSCLLLAKLLNFITESCKGKMNINEIYALTDSTIALSWIKNCSGKLEVFVSNRTNLIRSLTPVDNWFHISGRDNVADVVSRGQGPLNLKNNSQWWTGPEWLKSTPSNWPITAPYKPESEKSVLTLTALQPAPENPLLELVNRQSLHLELVSDLSTQNFLQAFKRFISRRGSVREIFSDNGTNFLGAKAELDNLYRHLFSVEHNQTIEQYLAVHGIKWHLIPPSAPHMGGLWESNVKAVKTHLFKGIKNQILTYEELNTILTQIEALLNSRPLCVLSSDPTDPAPLTPSHFLTLGPLSDIPAPDVTDIRTTRLSRYQLLDQIIQNFWRRWHVEYLRGLQSRSKWREETPTIEVGDIVLLELPNNPPLNWPLGIIERLYPGADGITRVVDVRTKTGTYRRPLKKIFKLPTQ